MKIKKKLSCKVKRADGKWTRKDRLSRVQFFFIDVKSAVPRYVLILFDAASIYSTGHKQVR